MSGRALVPMLAVVAVAAVGAVVGTGLLTEPESRAASASTRVRAPGSTATAPVADATREAVDRAALRVGRFSRESGFGSLRLDYEGARVLVSWQGRPPAGLVSLAQRDLRGVDVVLENATYSAADLDRAAKRLFKAHFADRLEGASLVGTLPRDDGSGIVAEIVEPWEGSEQELARIAGVPVTVIVIRPDQAPQPLEGD